MRRQEGATGEGIAILTIHCIFRLAGSDVECRKESVLISPGLLELCGEVYSEHLILYTTCHYEKYIGSDIPIGKTYLHEPPGDYILRNFKVRASVVTGHIAESIVVPALALCLRRSMIDIPFQRLMARIRCPDYRIVLRAKDVASLWPWRCTPAIDASAELRLPLEVKATTKTSQNVPKEAFLQLYQYWQECRRDDRGIIGWGIVARMCHFSTLTYYLFMPKTDVAATDLLKCTADDLWSERGSWFC